MNNRNGGREFQNCYEDECEYESIDNKDFDFDECFINDVGCNDNEDCDEVYKEGFYEGFYEGFKNGYEKAKKEVLIYMKKNKCCIKCKCKCKLRNSNKNKCFKKCKHGCKLRCINVNKNFHKMIKCM